MCTSCDFMYILTKEQVDSFKSFIDHHASFIIAGHKEPDGDCIASCLGILAIIESMNKTAIMLSSGPFKRPEIKEYDTQFERALPFMTSQECKETGVIVVDCSEISRVGEIEGDISVFDTFVIDHHKTSDAFFLKNAIIVPNCPAASLLVLDLYQAIIGFPDLRLSNIFFLGIATDTGYFRFLNEKNAFVFEAVAHLVNCGVNPKIIHNKITGGKSFSSRKLLGVLLNKAQKYLEGRLIVTYETMEDTLNFSQEGRDSDALYSMLLSVEGVEVVLFVRQETESTCTAGLRSLDKIDVSIVATRFGGGGHKNAAGLSLKGRVDTVIPVIVKEIAKAMQ